MNEHVVTINEERNQPDTMTNSVHTNIKCSCGWEERIKFTTKTDPQVAKSILYHRVYTLEKIVGVRFTYLFGKST